MRGVSTRFARTLSKLRTDLGGQPPEVTTKFGQCSSLGCCTGAEGHAYPLAAGRRVLRGPGPQAKLAKWPSSFAKTKFKKLNVMYLFDRSTARKQCCVYIRLLAII